MELALAQRKGVAWVLLGELRAGRQGPEDGALLRRDEHRARHLRKCSWTRQRRRRFLDRCGGVGLRGGSGFGLRAGGGIELRRGDSIGLRAGGGLGWGAGVRRTGRFGRAEEAAL